ncbi:MAG: carboxypeptidase regulatory-like domain-containing protein [Fibrobacterales bacterium]
MFFYDHYRGVFALLFVYVLSACTVAERGELGITDIESGGSIAGTVYTVDGQPAYNAKVRLVPRGAMHKEEESVLTATTDNDGTYVIEDIPDKSYALEIDYATDKQGLYKGRVTIEADASEPVNDTLKKTGELVITFPYSEDAEAGVVSLYNTTYSAQVIINDSWVIVTFSDVPPGYYTPLLLVDEEVAEAPFDTEYFKITANDTLTEIYAEVSAAPSSNSSSSFSSSSAVSSSSSSSVDFEESSVDAPPSMGSESSSEVSSSSFNSSVQSLSSSEEAISSSAYSDDTQTLHLNGIDEYIAIDETIDKNWPQYGITMELWVQNSDIYRFSSLMSLSAEGNDQFRIELVLGPWKDTPSLHYKVFNALDPSLSVDTKSTEIIPVAIENDEWNHIAVTVTPDTLLSVYINGSAIYSEYTEKNALPDSMPRTDNLIGASSNVVGGHYTWYSACSVDNVRLWNRALSSDEIVLNLTKNTSQIADRSGLVFGYDFLYSSSAPGVVLDNTGRYPGRIVSDAITQGAEGMWRPAEDFSTVIAP